MQRSFIVLGMLLAASVSVVATPAQACLWAAGSAPASSVGKMAASPRTEVERKHRDAHRDALVAHLGAVARQYASPPSLRPTTNR